jgi:hypothetical protein
MNLKKSEEEVTKFSQGQSEMIFERDMSPHFASGFEPEDAILYSHSPAGTATTHQIPLVVVAYRGMSLFYSRLSTLILCRTVVALCS